jgi:serine/threonine protein kinase/tetratricopeptide (TPR) repeat protein
MKKNEQAAFAFMNQSKDYSFGNYPTDVERAKARNIRESLRDLLTTQPLISPHAELVFETIEKIGEGGMGAVYRVLDRRLNRYAALKIINKSNQQSGSYDRFLRETLITARLNHPAIPPVYEVGMTAESQPFLLMRLLEGETLGDLSDRLHERGCTVDDRRRLIEIVIKACEAVAYAHSRGIIHRDLKPDNIMVGRFGDVLVMDWGIARDLQRDDYQQSESCLQPLLPEDELQKSGLTVAGTVIGTPGYMSPEQSLGNCVDERADVFSLGAVLVRVISGEPLIPGDSIQSILYATMSGTIAVPPLPMIGRDFSRLVGDALAVDPMERTESVEELALQLKAFLAGQEIPGYRYNPAQRFLRLIRQRPGLFLGIMVTLVFITSLLALWSQLEKEQEQSQRLVLLNQLKLEKESRAREIAEKTARNTRSTLDKVKLKVADSAKAQSFFNQARDRVRRKLYSNLILESIDEALSYGGRTKNNLLTAAKILEDGAFYGYTENLLEEIVNNYPPAYSALFQLHRLQLKTKKLEIFTETKYLRELILRATEREDENEFTLFSLANRYHNRRKLKKAIELYGRVEKYTARLGIMYLNRGSARFDVGDIEGSRDDCLRAIKINPKDTRSIYNLGKAYHSLKQFTKALDCFDLAIKMDPNDSMSLANRAAVKTETKKYQEALIDINKAHSIQPDNSLILASRGGIMWLLGQKSAALKDFNQSIKIDPGNPQTLTNRGRVYADMGQHSAALKDYSKALEIDKDCIAGYYRGILFVQLQRMKEAIKDLSHVIDVNPRHAGAYVYRGMAFIRFRKWRNVVADQSRAISIDSNNSQAYYQRGRAYLALRQFDKAMSDLSNCIAMAPKISDAYSMRALNFNELGQYKEAIEDCNTALSLTPNRLNPLAFRGYSFMKLGQKKAAIRDLNRFVLERPKDAFCSLAKKWLEEAHSLD